MAAADRDILPARYDIHVILFRSPLNQQLHSVKPSNYDISLFDLELGGSYTYQGIVKIDVESFKATKEIVLNTLDLQLHTAGITGSDIASRLRSSAKPFDLYTLIPI